MSWYARERGVEPTLLSGMAREIRPARDWRTLLTLRRLFTSERPTVVHTHTAKAGTLGRAAAAWAGVPVRIHTFHGHVLGGDYFSPARTRVFLELERRLAAAATRLIVLTQTQRHEMAERLHIADASRFVVVPLGLDLAPFRRVEPAAARPRARAELGIGADERVIGIVGRLVPIKNHELMLDAFARLTVGHGPPWRLLVVGGGEAREQELRARAERLGVAGRVLWLGWRRDLPTLLPAMDAAVLTSRDEGTPVALLEALAAGIPVAATGVGGVPEVLDRGRLGELADPGDAESVAAAVVRAVAREVPAAVRDAVVRRFSVERLCADVAALYRAEAERAGVPVDRPPTRGSFRA